MHDGDASTARPVAVLGTGAMGSALARALLRAGHPTTVWNRTAERAQPLVQEGARPAGSAAAAVSAAELVLVCVSDYDAADAVLAAAGDAVTGASVMTVVTGSPDRAEALARWLGGRGARLLDAVVHGAPEQVGTPAAGFSASGDRALFDRHEHELRALGRVRFVGERPGAANLRYLALLGLWYQAQAACLEVMVLLAGAGQDPREVAPAVAEQLGHVVAGAAATAEEVATATFLRGPASLREHAAVLADVVAVHPPGSDAALARIADLVRERAAVRPDEGFSGAVAAPVSASGETGLR